MRVPTKEEEIRARLKAARYLADNSDAHTPIDPDVWTVDTAASFVLAYACCSDDGTDRYTPQMLMGQFTADEQIELLDRLDAFRLKESRSMVDVDEKACREIAAALAGCDDESDARQVCAGMNRETMVRIALGLSRIVAAQPVSEDSTPVPTE